MLCIRLILWGWKICQRKLEEHLRLLIAISTFFQNRTAGNETAVNSDLLELVRELTDYLKEVINSDAVELASRDRQHRNEFPQTMGGDQRLTKSERCSLDYKHNSLLIKLHCFHDCLLM